MVNPKRIGPEMMRRPQLSPFDRPFSGLTLTWTITFEGAWMSSAVRGRLLETHRIRGYGGRGDRSSRRSFCSHSRMHF